MNQLASAPKGRHNLAQGASPGYSTGPYFSSPEGATHSGCVAPSGLLRQLVVSQTQGLRPGLSCAAPSGLNYNRPTKESQSEHKPTWRPKNCAPDDDREPRTPHQSFRRPAILQRHGE